MLQSHHFFKFLFIAAFFLCVNTGSLAVTTASRGGTELLRAKLTQVFKSEIGVREKKQLNDGVQVEMYLKYTGLKKGSPWCSAFVCWCLGKAGIPNPRTAWSPSLFPRERIVWQRERNIIPTIFRMIKKPPEPGDVFGLFFPEKNRIAHCGFIESWGDKWVITVEGNTNESGSREGDGVYRKRRLQQQLYCVASYLK